MSTYKQFLTSDVIISPLEVNKGFYLQTNPDRAQQIYYLAETSSDTLPGVGIDRLIGLNLILPIFNPNTDPQEYRMIGSNYTGQISKQYQRLVYNSIKELYYSNYLQSIYSDPVSRGILIPGRNEEGNRLVGSSSNQSYNNYLQSDLTYPRYFPTSSNSLIGVIAIPNILFGDYIQPTSFRLDTVSGSFIDDGEGNITTGSVIIGNIIYPHGIIIFTGNQDIAQLTGSIVSGSSYYNTASYNTSDRYAGAVNLGLVSSSWSNILLSAINDQVTCSFSSSYKIYETQYKCTIREKEFTYTLNPSTISGSNGDKNGIPYGYITSSYFAPFITTVGLYDEQQNLLAIGKLAQPLPSSPTSDITILINIDK